MYEILCLNKATNSVNQVDITKVQELLTSDNNVIWVDIENPPNVWPNAEEMNLLTAAFHIHQLSIEDCVAEMHHSKIEEYSNYLLLVIYGMKQDNKLKFQDIELILGKNFLISYRHEEIHDIEIVKNNFKAGSNSQCTSSLDLFYSIIDHLIDGYLPIIDNFDIQISRIEEILFKDPANIKLIKHLNSLRESMNYTRQIIVLENEIVYSIIKRHYSSIPEDRIMYFRDIYDHLERHLAKMDNLKESISNLLGVQMNINTQNLNEIMKFLTVISTILLPANLIAGIFGMNFVKIPLLHSSSGPIFAVISMFVIALTMIIYFKHRRWL